MATKIETWLVSELVEDLDLYPRSSVDSTNVTRIADALEAGAKLPPVIADRKTRRIVDGIHRRRAILRLYGEEAECRVEPRDYESDQDLYLDAAKLNSSHGKPLNGSDRTHAIIRAVDLGIADSAIADAIGVSLEKVHTICTIKAGLFRPSGTAQDGKRLLPIRIPLKNSVRHLYGTHPQFTPEQARVLESSPGQSQWLLVKQLADLIEVELFDWTDEHSIEELRRLYRVIGERIKQ